MANKVSTRFSKAASSSFVCLVFVMLVALALCMGYSLTPQQASADDGNATLTGGSLGVLAESDATTVTIDVTYGQTEARKMLDMINDFRTGPDAWEWNSADTEKEVHTDLKPLAYDYELERVAMIRAAELALKYSHTRLDGVSGAWDDINGSYTTVGENIAAGYNSYTTAASVFEGWQETNEPYDGQGHRRNMLNADFTAVGIGHVVCNGAHYWVQVFCAPVLNSTKTAAVDSQKDVTLSVANSIITKRSASASPSGLTLHPGESVSLPAVTAGIATKDTWPFETAAVKTAAPAWTAENTSVASVKSGRVVGGAVGKTTLSASVDLGESVSLEVPVEVVPWDVSSASVARVADVVYTGKSVSPKPVIKFGGKTLSPGIDYKLSYKNNKKAGKATIVVKGMGNFTGTKTVTFKIKQAANSASVSKTSVSKAFAANKKTKKLAAAKTVALPKVTTKFGTTKWKVTAKDKKGVLSLKSGKVQVKKGAKKGTYTMKLKATVSKTANYKAASTKVVTVKVRVK